MLYQFKAVTKIIRIRQTREKNNATKRTQEKEQKNNYTGIRTNEGAYKKKNARRFFLVFVAVFLVLCSSSCVSII